MVPFVLGAVIAWLSALRREDRWRSLLAGCLVGCAVMLKQTSGVTALSLAIGGFLWWRARRFSCVRLVRLGVAGVLGSLVITVPAIGFVVAQGRFADMWRATVGFNVLHLASGHETEPSVVWTALRELVQFGNGISLIIPAAVIAAVIGRTLNRKSRGFEWAFFLVWALFECVGVAAGGWYFLHYFRVFAAVISIAAAAGLVEIWTGLGGLVHQGGKKSRRTPMPATAYLPLVSALGVMSIQLAAVGPVDFVRKLVPRSRPIAEKVSGSFVETIDGSLGTRVPINLTGRFEQDPSIAARIYANQLSGRRFLAARYISERTEPGDPIFVWDENAAVYFWSERTNPTRFRDKWPLLADVRQSATSRGAYPDYRQNQSDLLTSLRESRPLYVCLVEFKSQLRGDLESFPELLTWIRRDYTPDVHIGDVWILRRIAAEGRNSDL